MGTDFRDIGKRIQGIREACDVTREELAEELGVDAATYLSYEETGANVPISAIYHIATKFGVDFNEILTGGPGRLDTYQVVRAGEGRTVDRYPGYHYQDLAWRYGHKIMQPLLVTLDPTDDPAPLVTHTGQEFNLVLEGEMAIMLDDKEVILAAGDSVYFNPMIPHGQKCNGPQKAVFVTAIAE